MKNLRKALAAVIALSVMCMSVSAFAEVTASGEFTSVNGAVSADYTDFDENKVGAEVDTTKAALGTEMTFIVLNNNVTDTMINNGTISESNILYIDQKTLAAGNNTFTGAINLSRVNGYVSGDTIPVGSYPIRVGYYYDNAGVNTFAIASATMVVAETQSGTTITIVWGDITLDAEIDVADALAALYYAAGTPRSYPTTATAEFEANQCTVGSTVGGYLWGDITLDTEIDVADALAALYYAAGTPRTYEGVTVGSDVDITVE